MSSKDLLLLAELLDEYASIPGQPDRIKDPINVISVDVIEAYKQTLTTK